MRNNLYFWKANRELSLVQAALLIIGEDPQQWDVFGGADGRPEGFDAIYQALLRSVNNVPWDENGCDFIPVEGDFPKGGYQWRDGHEYFVRVEFIKEWLKNNKIESDFFSDNPNKTESSEENIETAYSEHINTLTSELDAPHREIVEVKNKQHHEEKPPVSTSSTGRAHVSEKLATLNQAAHKWWANANPNDRSTHPSKKDVMAWLMEHDFSQKLADSAATIIRPDWAPVGRKSEE